MIATDTKYSDEQFAACLLECGPHTPAPVGLSGYHKPWEQERARVYTWYIEHIYVSSLLEGEQALEQSPRRVALWVDFWRQYRIWIEDKP